MTTNARPTLTFWQIWNMCFGFLGLQFGFALQNANVSRIFQTLGASVDAIPSLWIAAPLTGLLVQPIIGYCSDRTWTRLGRRRPYFLVGALLASIALLAMPRSGALWIAAGLLWLLDASINISMEPFRAFVGDQLGPAQRPAGYSMQSFFIGAGAVVASVLPWLFTRFGISNHGTDAAGHAVVPDTLYYSFGLGALVLLAAVGWTVLRTREYPPGILHAFDDSAPDVDDGATPAGGGGERGRIAAALAWTAAGLVAIGVVAKYRLDRQLFLVSGMALAWGVAQLLHAWLPGRGFFATIMDDLENMPHTMRRLIPVQFFSWLALFSMWLYTTPAVTQVHFHSSDPATAAYNDGADWVGFLFGAYNGFAALAAIVIPLMVRRLGLQRSHLVNVWLGGAGLISMALIRDPQWLLASMLGVGFAWASILALPYALLSDSLPSRKMGVYMGIFNFFIVIPQLVAASVLGFVLKTFLDDRPIEVLVLGGVCFLIAGLLSLRVPLHTSRARPA
ncbi:MAG TPA: MFS transporter [Steroidobacteraceae bacterium]|nr:MFS transporter [Steroidobacteraceae bacterium]